ncbi:TPA: prenyltransferase [Candidatus Galligastranaerophilus intestinigallinarum]|nr:prenyltransferase [Candidatus Galligastranaerophilus intestinigallinarum]
MDMNKNLKELLRTYSLPMSVAPFILALCCSIKTPFVFGILDNSFFLNAILLLIGIILIHLTGNLFDDYLDVKSALDAGIPLNEINFKNKKKARLILNKTYSLKTVEIILISMLISAFIIGLYFISQRGFTILSYMIIAVILCSFYPISSKYGLSEIVIGAIFGPLLINASYFALTGQFDPKVFVFSIASGIMTSVLLITHSLMDYEYDVETGKKTLPVLLNNKNLTINFISFLILISYFLLTLTSYRYGVSRLIFIIPILCTIPVGYKLIMSLYDYIEIKNVQFIPKWYYGFMENFEEIKKEGFAYFMFRFYLARNLGIIFNIVLAIVCLYAFVPVQKFEFIQFNFINQFLF